MAAKLGSDIESSSPVCSPVIQGCPASERPDTFSQPYILLIEDNDGDVYLIREILKALPYALDIITDGAAAISRLRQIDLGLRPQPVAVLLDLGLPKRTGLEVLEACPRFTGSSPLLIITSSDRDQDRAHVAALGATAYFVKPANFDAYYRLYDIVSQLLAEGIAKPVAL
jgi:CheY-like chemotaxis protein